MKFVNVLKSRVIFKMCAYVRCFNVKFSTYYFHMKTKILADFQICISVPLKFAQDTRLPLKSFSFPWNSINLSFCYWKEKMDRVQMSQGCWATIRRQFIFNHKFPGVSGIYLVNLGKKKLSQPWAKKWLLARAAWIQNSVPLLLSQWCGHTTIR